MAPDPRVSPELRHFVLYRECRGTGRGYGIEILYIQPGKPVQNAYIERFNRTFREEVLDAYLFEDLEQAQDMANDWLRGYNEQRPHESRGGLPPSMFREKVTAKVLL